MRVGLRAIEPARLASGARKWPNGYTGSVSHKGTTVVAAIAPTDRMPSIGIDVEWLDADGAPAISGLSGRGDVMAKLIEADTRLDAWMQAADYLLDFYPENVYPAIKKHPSIRWGTYAYRLVRRRVANGKHINPLQQMIEKMQSEITNAGPKRSCYELGVAEGEYDVPLHSPADDGARRMGGPCLSHLSFKLLDGAVHLTAFYRSHDYRYKVPGNLLGLARSLRRRKSMRQS